MNEPLTAVPVKPPIAVAESLKAKLQLLQVQLEKAHDEGRTEFRTVLGFIAYHRRVDETQASPQPFRKIANMLSQLTGVDTTHEAVRRWQRQVEKGTLVA